MEITNFADYEINIFDSIELPDFDQNLIKDQFEFCSANYEQYQYDILSNANKDDSKLNTINQFQLDEDVIVSQGIEQPLEALESPSITKENTAKKNVEESKENKESKPKILKVKEANLAERKDVVNRSILRGIKKYFLESFLEEFPDYVTKRICRVFKPALFEDVQKYCKIYTNDPYIAEAIFCLLRPNSIDFIANNKELMEEAKAYLDCVQKYSHSKLNGMLSSRFMKEIFSFIFNDEAKTQQFLKINNQMLKYPDTYRSEINNIVQSML